MKDLRAQVIRLAASFPKGSQERGQLLSLVKVAASWSKQTITIRTYQGSEQADALVTGVWAVHKTTRGNKWVVTFVPSGQAVGYTNSKRKAMLAVETILDTIPGMLNASEAQVKANGDNIISIIEGKLPFELILKKAGLQNLGERYGKAGAHWGIPGGSKLIRIGARDVVLSVFNVTGYKEHKGRLTLTGQWSMKDIEYQSKMTRPRLDKWITEVKAAPSTEQLRKEFRET